MLKSDALSSFVEAPIVRVTVGDSYEVFDLVVAVFEADCNSWCSEVTCRDEFEPFHLSPINPLANLTTANVISGLLLWARQRSSPPLFGMQKPALELPQNFVVHGSSGAIS